MGACIKHELDVHWYLIASRVYICGRFTHSNMCRLCRDVTCLRLWSKVA